jgi:hypothetical protein
MTDRNRWTIEEDELLRSCWDRLPTRRAIAERLDRSLEAVKRRGRYLGLPRRDRTPRQNRGQDYRLGSEPLDRTRNCLMCGERFRTTRYQFVCPTCKSGELW